MKQLNRSRRKKVLFGLCGGLSDYFNVDANLLRILTIILAICTSGGAIVIYILAALVIPKERDYNDFPPPGGNFGPYSNNNRDFYGNQQDPRHQGFGSGAGTAPPGGPYRNPPYQQGGSQPQQDWQADTSRQADLDKMMDDLEKKALRNELDELKAKLSKYEKGE